LTAPLATDWVELLLGPIWSAIVALIALALVVAFRRPLGRLLWKLGVTRINLLGVDVEWIVDQTADAYRHRQLPVPAIPHLRAFGILSARLAPLVKNHRLLWVDDNPQGNNTEARLLRRLGVEIEGATDTRQALDSIAGSPAPFDLVISDWDRGGGDDALDLVRQMRSQNIEIPVVVYAGMVDAYRRAKAADLGISAVVREPDALLSHVLVELSLA
jgi:CheY-like chemotaxis protein